MTLNSFYFLLFMLLVVAITALLQFAGKKGLKKYTDIQKLFLLIFSYIFIGLSNYKYAIIIFLTSVFVYIMGVTLEKRKEKVLLFLSIVILVIELACFKYTNFFLSTLAECFHMDFVLLNIILPLGISFYIFTSIAYLVDVFKKKYSAEKSFLNLSLMISLFTKVISGPIVRGDEVLPQLNEYKGISLKNIQNGTQVFFLGLFKKIVLADNLSVFVNDVFAAPSAFNTFSVLLAVISFSLQIYYDFSGYSDMAIGASEILGITIRPNFNLPYIAKSPSEFWSRWHISLSSWLKDYLYFPLGGNRKGNTKTYMNLLIVMIISGLWHGAGWTFIAWGLLHGVYSCVYRCVDNMCGKRLSNSKNVVLSLLMVAVNFLIVTVLWIFFRADSLPNAFSVIRSCFTIHTGINQPYTWSFFTIVILIVSTVDAVFVNRKHGNIYITGFYPSLDLSKIHNQVLFFVFIGITMIIGYFGDTAFIYGAF